MDAWLGPGFQPSEIERRSILSRLSNCALTTTNPDGALSSRTALIERVTPSGATLTVRLLGSGLYDDVVTNPRVQVMAHPAMGPHDLVVVSGLARIQSHMASGNGREILLLDVTIQRMECWSTTPVAQAPRPLMPLADERAGLRHETMTLRHA